METGRNFESYLFFSRIGFYKFVYIAILNLSTNHVVMTAIKYFLGHECWFVHLVIKLLTKLYTYNDEYLIYIFINICFLSQTYDRIYIPIVFRYASQLSDVQHQTVAR